MLRNATSRATATTGRSGACKRLVQSRRLADTAPSHNNSINNNNTRRYSIEPRRSFASPTASDKKRALNKQQLRGASKQEPTRTPSRFAPPAASETDAGGGGRGGSLLAVLAVTTGGVGAAYYNGLLDGYLGEEQKSTSVLGTKAAEKPSAKPSAKPDMKKTKEEQQPPSSAPAKAATPKKPSPSTDKADASLAEIAKEEVALSKKEVEDFNQIIADVVGEASAEVEGVREVVAAIAEEEKKTTQAAETAAAAAKAVADAASKAQESAAAAAAAATEAAAAPVATVVASSLDESKIMAEIEDLKKQLHQRSDTALEEAHTELAKLGSIDVMGLDLDKMTRSQLKVRLVQMARDLEERTKWEAVRLQEFLSMKEKEVEDRCVFCAEVNSSQPPQTCIDNDCFRSG